MTKVKNRTPDGLQIHDDASLADGCTPDYCRFFQYRSSFLLIPNGIPVGSQAKGKYLTQSYQVPSKNEKKKSLI